MKSPLLAGIIIVALLGVLIVFNRTEPRLPDVSMEPSHVELNATTTFYNNPRLGFGITLPPLVSVAYATWTSPVMAYDNGVSNVVYLSTYEYPEKNFSPVRVQNNYQKIDAYHTALRSGAPAIYVPYWRIEIADVASDTDLSMFIQKTYGKSCSVGPKTQIEDDLYAVDLVGDGKPLDETLCPVNYGVAIMYAPKRGKVATWSLGQAVTFMSGTEEDAQYGRTKMYDIEMRDSFRFH